MSRSRHELRQELLTGIAEPDLDLDRAAQRVAATRAGRRRRRRNRTFVMGGTTVALLAVVLIAAVVGTGGGEEVVADGASTTTTTEASDDADAPDEDEGSTLADDAGGGVEAGEVDPSALETLPTEPAPARPPALVTPEPPPVVTAAPLPVPPPVVDEPLVVEVSTSSATPVAGEGVVVEIAWLDADHLGGAPRIRVDWGDPLLQPTVYGPDELDCRGAGRPVGSVERAETRFASPGPRTVRVEVVACDGPAGTSQRAVSESGVVVAGPSHGGAPGRTVVAHVAPGLRLPGRLDQAVASFRPADGLAVGLGQRRPTLDQRAADGPATTIVVPGTGSGAGRLELTWPGQPCRASAELGPAPVGSARLVPLTVTC